MGDLLWTIVDLALSIGGMFSRDEKTRREARLGCATTLGIVVVVAVVLMLIVAMRR
ncbi:MAG: hypothetical protein QM783_13850 [Phycisphaerales bacterium]